MVCKVCGAEVVEGAKFCPSCGTPVEKTVEAAAETIMDRVIGDEIPGEAIPADPAPDYPDPTPVYQDPAPVYQDPTPVYPEPAEPEPLGGGPVPPPADPGPVFPGDEPEPEKPKKKKWLIPAIAAAAVIVVVALILLIPRLLANAGKPVDQYHKVELKGLKSVSDSAANYYGNLLAMGDKADDFGLTGSAELNIDEEFFDLVGSGGEDLSWLKTLRMEYELNKKDDLTGGAVTLKLNKDKLTTANLLLDLKEQMIYLQAPDISKNFLGADLEDMTDSAMGSLRYYLPSSLYWTLRSVLSDTDPEAAEQVQAVLEALPTQEQFKKLLDKYLEIAVNSIENVERDKDTLEAGEVSAQYTTLTVTINEKAAMKIVENVLTELKKDKDVKDYIQKLSKALEEDPEDTYEAFIESLDETLEAIEDTRENGDPDSKQKIVMTLYVDGKGNIAGREIRTNFDSNIKFRYAVPVKGGKIGIDISLKEDSETLFALAGTGKISGSSVSFDAALKVQGSKLLEISAEKIDGAKLKKGYFKGSVTLKPGADLMYLLFKMSGSEERMFKKMSLTLDLDTAKNTSNVKLILNYEDSPLVSLALSGKSGSAKKVSPVKDYLESEEWVEELNGKDLKAFLKNLKKTDIPSEYLEELEDYIDRYF